DKHARPSQVRSARRDQYLGHDANRQPIAFGRLLLVRHFAASAPCRIDHAVAPHSNLWFKAARMSNPSQPQSRKRPLRRTTRTRPGSNLSGPGDVEQPIRPPIVFWACLFLVPLAPAIVFAVHDLTHLRGVAVTDI